MTLYESEQRAQGNMERSHIHQWTELGAQATNLGYAVSYTHDKFILTRGPTLVVECQTLFDLRKALSDDVAATRAKRK